MSKVITNFFDTFATAERMIAQLFGKTPAPGSRIVPTNKKRDDGEAQFRIDAGLKIGSKQTLNMQANSQATSAAVQEWIRKNGRGTHGTLASTTFDTEAEDLNAEIEKARQDLKDKAKSNL